MRFAISLIILFLFSLKSSFCQVLETEESNPLVPSQFEVGTGIEFQTSLEGTETAMPIGIEYGLTKKITILAEPVAFTNIHNKTGISATDIGDVEITVFYQLFPEMKSTPSVSIAGEVKLPVAKNNLIGTGKTDFTPYIIATKTSGKFFTSINLGYTFLGKPKGVKAGNLLNYALGSIYTISDNTILFAEVFGNTSAYGKDLPETTGVTPNPNITTEISGGEVVGSTGAGFYLKKEMLISLGVSYDNNHALLLRPGIEWSFGRRNPKVKVH